MQSMFTYSQPRALFSRNIKMQSIVFMEYVFTLWFFFFGAKLAFLHPRLWKKLGQNRGYGQMLIVILNIACCFFFLVV